MASISYFSDLKLLFVKRLLFKQGNSSSVCIICGADFFELIVRKLFNQCRGKTVF